MLELKDTTIELPVITRSAMGILSISAENREKAAALCQLGVRAATAKDLDTAMQLYGGSLVLNPFDPLTYAHRSISCAVAGKDLDRALLDAEKSLELESTARGYRAKGITLLKLGWLNEARVALAEGLKIVGDEPDLHRRLLNDEAALFNTMGDKAFAEGKHTAAVDLYGRAHDRCPTKSQYLANRSRARRKLGQWDLAITDAEESLRIRPTVYGYLQKARACSGRGGCAEAILAIDAGLALDKYDKQLEDLKVDVLIQHADIARCLTDYEKAVELCTAALKIRRDNRCLALRAWCRYSDPVAALEDAEQSLCIKPTALCYGIKGTMLNHMKRYREAFVAFNTGLEFPPSTLFSHRELESGKWYAREMQDRADKALSLSDQATIAMKGGDYDQAIEIYSQAIELDTSSATTWRLRGSSWLAKQVWNKALEDAQESVERNPTVDGYCIMAEALRSSGKYLEAVEAFGAAIDLRIGHASNSPIRTCIEQDTARHWSEQAAIVHRVPWQSEEFLTIALAFNPCDGNLYASRSHVRIKQEKWSAALHDAQKCLRLARDEENEYSRKVEALYGAKDYDATIKTISTTVKENGYLRKFEALYGVKDYDAAIKTISIAVKDLRVSNLNDNNVSAMKLSVNVPEVPLQRWRDPDQVAADILHMAEDITLEMPPRLFNTTTGQLCKRSDMLEAFKTSDAYKELVAQTASGLLVDQIGIRNHVEHFFRYVTLSHRWDVSHPEPTHADIVADVYSLMGTKGVEKLRYFCHTAANLSYKWAWSDTCCIDKASSTEVQKSITSMATWFQRSALTIVHLADVSDSTPESFKSSDWFTRGWTLQELLAPPVIRFYKADWTSLLKEQDTPFNHKDNSTIMDWLVKATGIDTESLRQFTPGCDGAREKLRWASTRRTTEEEDAAYSLMGILDLQIPVMYGELKQKALGRLLQEVVGSSGDLSILQWSGTSGSFSSCLPSDISAFQEEPWKPHELSDTIITQSIARLRQKITVDSDVLDFQQKLQSYHPAPMFQHGRLTLTCIVHHVVNLQPVVKRSSPKNRRLYNIQAKGLKPFRVAMDTEHLNVTSSLRHHRDFIVIRPWNPDFHSGLTPLASRDPERLTLEACVQLEQPFYALVLSRRRRGYYRRVAGAVVEIKDIVEVLRTMSIERLEIF